MTPIISEFDPSQKPFPGTSEEVQLGDGMVHVVVRGDDNLVKSAITRRGADELELKKGGTVVALVKATEITIQKD